MEKYIKVEDTIYGLQNIRKVQIEGIERKRSTTRGVTTIYCIGCVRIYYTDNDVENIHLYSEDDTDKMRKMQKDLVERIYKILLDK